MAFIRGRELEKGKKVPKRALVDVKWLDACAHMRVARINPSDLTELLCESHTMGKVVAQDRKVLVVAGHMNNEEGADILAIPIRWIEDVTIFEEAR